MPVSRRGLFGLVASAAVAGPSVVAAASTAPAVKLEMMPIAPSVRDPRPNIIFNRLDGAQHIYNQRRSRLIANA